MKSNFWKYERGTFRKFNFDKAVKDINEQYQTLKEIDLGSAKGKTSTYFCLLYTSPSPRDRQKSRMPSSA